MEQNRERFRVKSMCKVLEVSRAGYYAWRKRLVSARERANQELLKAIQAVYEESRKIYGYRKVHAQVKKNMPCSLNRVARLMRLAGLRSRRIRRYRSTTYSQHKRPVAPNVLAQDFTALAPNQKWVADITFIPTAEGWLYLAALLDLCSRKIVGWAMESYLVDQLTIKALEMALDRRQPPQGLLHHSDRGSQFASINYSTILAQNDAVPSMSRTGNAYDNAPMESFFATLKMELIHHRRYRTRQEARADIFEYIEVFYNRQRIHSALDYTSPAEFESLLLAAP